MQSRKKVQVYSRERRVEDLEQRMQRAGCRVEKAEFRI
jgi:hypothetical protein